MDHTSLILGPVVTEKAERQKAQTPHVYALRVHPQATKVDIAHALERLFHVEIAKVRVMRVRSKSRNTGRGSLMEKRQEYKKAIVTLKEKSKPLDLAALKTIS